MKISEPETDDYPTPEEIDERLAEIRSAARDFERAHGMEDQLHQDVLQGIAAGAYANPSEVAERALLSLEIEFDRYCA